jgi:polyhydroxyalkanoate synthesis regulator phasin
VMRLMPNRRNVQLAVLGAGVATILIGLAAAGAVAASRALSPGEESKAVIDDAAAQLGVKPSALSEALKQALKNRLDAAVAAGRLTKAQADELKARIDSGDGLPFFGGPRPGLEVGPGHFDRPFGHFRNLEAAASYLGLTEAQLRDQLQTKTLAEIAKDKGKSVDGLVQALVTSAENAIDEAVADGRLTQQQATDIKAHLKEHIERLVTGEFREHGFGFHPGFGPGAESPRGPPAFAGPRA